MYSLNQSLKKKNEILEVFLKISVLCPQQNLFYKLLVGQAPSFDETCSFGAGPTGSLKFGLRIWVEPTYNVQDSAEPHYRQLLQTRGKICVAGSLVWSVLYSEG